MVNAEFESNIGKQVISASFGEGVISEITEMNGEPFYVVLNQSNNMKHYVPINDSSAYRYLSDENEFLKIIEKSLIKNKYDLDFESKKDRINYYKNQSKVQKLESICQNIKTLHLTDDRGTLEDQIYQRLIENLALEYTLIKNIEFNEANQFICDYIEKIN